MILLKNISILYQCRDEGTQGDLFPIPHAAIVWDGSGVIQWVGAEQELPKEYSAAKEIDAGGRIVLPGLVDCHTHLAFGGERSGEFESRILGKSYLDIAKAGGGILSTVRSTRESSSELLLERCERHLREMIALGVTTVECKSGYGLTLNDELKILKTYQALSERTPVTIVSTFLGAHTVPAEFRDKRGEYIDLIINKMLPAVAEQGLASFCDVFVEEAAFSRDEATRILEAGKKIGLRPKLHVDQLSDGDGARLAVTVGAVSADHLEYISDAGIEALADSSVVAVTLPLASLYTFQRPLQARRLIERGIPVAVATDFNPGSAPSYHLPLALMLTCTLNRLRPREAVKGATIYGAKALGLDGKLGSLEVGKFADLALLDAPSVDFWLYQFRANCCVATIKQGALIAGSL